MYKKSFLYLYVFLHLTYKFLLLYHEIFLIYYDQLLIYDQNNDLVGQWGDDWEDGVYASGRVDFHELGHQLYEDGDFGFRLHVGFVRFFGCRFVLSAQIALKVSEIESMGSSASILMSRFFSDSI